MKTDNFEKKSMNWFLPTELQTDSKGENVSCLRQRKKKFSFSCKPVIRERKRNTCVAAKYRKKNQLSMMP